LLYRTAVHAVHFVPCTSKVLANSKTQEIKLNSEKETKCVYIKVIKKNTENGQQQWIFQQRSSIYNIFNFLHWGLKLNRRHTIFSQQWEQRIWLTESAVCDVTDPVIVLAGKVPGFQRVITSDHGVVTSTS